LDDPSEFDKRIIEQFLPDRCAQKVVIVGHTHAARDVRLPGDRAYFNSGTWTNLLDLSDFNDSEENLRTLIDKLEAGTWPGFTRLTWAEVTADWPLLHEVKF
jgi:hypothetical protein